MPRALQFSNILKVLGIFNLDFIPALGLDCRFGGFNYLNKMVVVTLVPLAVSIILLWTYISMSLYARKKGAPYEKGATIIYLFLFFTFMILVSCSGAVFSYFACQDFPLAPNGELSYNGVYFGKERYLRVDYKVNCDSKEYIAMLPYALAMIFVYPLGIPLMYGSLLIQHAPTLRDKQKLLIEAANEFPNVGHVLFLVEACKYIMFYSCVYHLTNIIVWLFFLHSDPSFRSDRPEFYWFEVIILLFCN